MNYTDSTFYPQAALNESNMASGNVGTAGTMGAPSVATESTTAPAPTNSSSMPTNMADYGLDTFVSGVSIRKTNEYPNGTPTFDKIWIDGTVQSGKIIDKQGKILRYIHNITLGELKTIVDSGGTLEGKTNAELKVILDSFTPNQNLNLNIGLSNQSVVGAIESIKPQLPITISAKGDYPRDMGFVKGDGKGNYFYFEPLPAYKMEEIARLVQLKKEKEEAEAKAKALAALQASQKAKEEAARKAAEAKEKYERAKAEAEAKKIAQAETQRLAQQKAIEEQQQKTKKRNMILIIVGVVLASVIGFFFLKKKK